MFKAVQYDEPRGGGEDDDDDVAPRLATRVDETLEHEHGGWMAKARTASSTGLTAWGGGVYNCGYCQGGVRCNDFDLKPR